MIITKNLKAAIIIFSLCIYSCNTNSGNKDRGESAASEAQLLNENNQGVEEVLLENKDVKVLKASLQPGQQLPWHQGGPRVIYSLSDYSIRFKKITDDTLVNALRKGEVHWHDQNIHKVENVGNAQAEFLILMRKPSSLPDGSDITTESDVEEVKPSHTNTLLENNAVKVMKIKLASGEKAPMHVGTKRAVYSLSNYTVTFSKPGQSAEEQSFDMGDVHWHEGGEHSVENTGDKPAEFLVIEFKK